MAEKLEGAAGFVRIAEQVAREAGGLLREFYHRGVRTEYKGDVDLVTEADRASEKLIVARLHEALPEHGVYGEEGTRQGLEREFRWYIDPLDGTTNFAHGFPAFCVVLGCEQRAPGLKPDEDGEMAAGVIYDPLRDGETVSGWIEYFDDMMLRLTREGKPNLFIYKSQIRTISEGGPAGTRPRANREDSAAA